MGKTTIPSRAASVVEVGTSGIWTYRKWSDGTAECWGKSTKPTVALDINYTISYPTGLFVEAPNLSVCGGCNANVNSGVRYANSTSTSCDVWITTPNAAPSWLFAHAIGKWK